MMTTYILFLLVLATPFSLAERLRLVENTRPSLQSTPSDPDRQRGVCWVAGDSVTYQDFMPLIKSHVNWIVQTPFGWQSRYNSPSLRLVTDGRILWGERDTGITVTTRLAKKVGIKTLLKPHLWLTDDSDGKWRTEIAMASEADWQNWFASYGRFILHYAQLAEKLDIEALCIGTELHLTAVQRPADWRRLIADIRKIYSGQLTYAANWYREYEEIMFWDALDFIGIQGYFPLTDKPNPSVAALRAGWQPHLEAILKIQQRFNKPVVFTEIGYKSTVDAAIQPWLWPESLSELQIDMQTQANAYQAMFEVFWHHDWFAGAYIWKWFPKHMRAGGPRHGGFTPQNKGAQQVMTNWYGSKINAKTSF